VRLTMELNDVIAEQLTAMRKVGLETRTQLVEYARLQGWTE